MNIVPRDVSLSLLLTGSSTQFAVPEYQRDYAWTINEVAELFDDLIRSYEADSEYFVGTLVLSKEEQDEGQYEIVDGQQRLATFTILFSAIRAYAKNFMEDMRIFPSIERTSENRKTAERIATISNARIVCEGYPDNLFLILNKKDKSIFRLEVQESTNPLLEDSQVNSVKSESRIIKAKKLFFKFFKEVINSKPDGLAYLDGLLGFLVKKVKIISIEVESGYDAYLLFESLNSKGLDLSIADLLKNKMLMSATSSDEKDQVLQNWEDMFNSLDESQYNQVDFLRFYWAAFHKPTSKNELYKEIKSSLDRRDITLINLSNGLKSKSSNFSEITDKNLVWPTSIVLPNSKEQYFSEIGALKYQICLPALLYARSSRPELLLPLAKYSVSYLFRMITVGGNAVRLADDAFKKIIAAMKNNASESDVMGLFLTNPKAYDDQFKSEIANFTTENSNIARYILAKIHVHQTGNEQVPNSFHLEHILPQNPEKWKEAGFGFGENKEEDLINHIGNMTLLDAKVNVSISNKPFSEKISEYRQKITGVDGGTTFPMTYDLNKRHTETPFSWTSSEIKSRARAWSELAPIVWSLPSH